ncbi:MAG: wax ester/triacylglycerol synthase family O-acyltransferase [Micrococcales bacterium]|nr:wax ester/triacylglycerol synthase family O-acyltransferase [Micrococcales bacterium]
MCDDVAVPDRLSPLDASFLYLEDARSAMHVGSVMVFALPEAGLDLQRIVDLVAARIDAVPRYRQRVREMPAGLSAPVWIDDAAFDVSYHVRRSALPRPGSDDQLEEFVGRIQGRPLDRRHPLWELYVVEGLCDDRFAIVTKTHQALVDGINALDLGHLLLDESPEGEPQPTVDRVSRREPGDLELIVRTVFELATSPRRMASTARRGVGDIAKVAGRVGHAAGGLAGTLLRTAASPAPTSPLNVVTGASRRVRLVQADLKDFRAVREAMPTPAGGVQLDITINDVVLAVVAGALALWLAGRGEPVHSGSTVRALVPISVADGGQAVGLVSGLHAAVVDLPVGETNPRVRLEGIAYQMRRQARPGQAVGAASIAGLAGFAPPTLHHLGARMGSAMSRRFFNLVILNAPGPQQPLYASGARMLAGYPVIPLAAGQALSIGLTSYDGSMCIGLNADRGAMPDLDVLGDCLIEALRELLAQVEGGSQ